jgi:hypothetical protein
MSETVIIGVIWAVIVNVLCDVTACMLWTAIYFRYFNDSHFRCSWDCHCRYLIDCRSKCSRGCHFKYSRDCCAVSVLQIVLVAVILSVLNADIVSIPGMVTVLCMLLTIICCSYFKDYFCRFFWRLYHVTSYNFFYKITTCIIGLLHSETENKLVYCVQLHRIQLECKKNNCYINTRSSIPSFVQVIRLFKFVLVQMID